MSYARWELTEAGKRTGWALEDIVGLVSLFIVTDEAVPAAKQLDQGYAHGGGWSPFNGFIHEGDFILRYPGDPSMPPLAKCQLGDETILAYPHAWFAIFQPDGSFEVARMD